MAMNRIFSLTFKLNNLSLIKMLIIEENFKRHLEAFASELFCVYIVYDLIKSKYIMDSSNR